MSALLCALELEKSFHADHVDRAVLQGLSMEVDRGEWVAAMGPSGCGKSTMLHLLGGLDLPDAGSIRLDDDEITVLAAPDRARLRRRRVGYVFQQYNLIPHLDVTANVELPQRLAGTSRREARARSTELLETLGLGGRERNMPGTLSGGEQQRVAIARALANHPDLLLADEPTGALDSASAALVLDLLRARHDAGQTIVMVTHDPEVAAAADRIVHILDGQIVRVEPRRSVSAP
jgi:putative ABC transport system ATP-binding protein